MSVTTTDTTISPQVLLSTLGDYELHHSGLPAPPPNVRPDVRGGEQPASISNPSDWVTDERRVPPYRPINYNLDQEQRPGGSNLVERMFIATLLNGTALNAHMSQIWRKNFGWINPKVFHYKIGGEW